MKKLFLFVVAGALFAGCEDAPAPSSSYFDENIQPILQVGCVMQTTGCHLADERGRAVGNLDLSSYDALMRRQDVLTPYGPYSASLLLLKAGAPVTVGVETLGPPGDGEEGRVVTVTTDIRHNAGMGIGLDGSAYSRLSGWIASGFRRTGAPATDLSRPIGSCRSGAGSAPGFDPDTAPTDSTSYDAFRSRIQP